MKGSITNNQDNIVSKAKRMASLVDFQEGAIVSRTLVDKEAGTITLFAFDKGQGLSEHTAPYDAVVYIVEGEANFVISGKPVHLVEGEMTIMPAGEPHSLSASQKFKMLLIMIRS